MSALGLVASSGLPSREDLRNYVAYRVSSNDAPALSIAIGRGDQIATAAAGVINQSTGIGASEETLFQIGSISKVFTASLVFLLADRGLIDLDRPVQDWMPEFRVADRAVSAAVTPRHLLAHTSGLETDIYADDLWDDGPAIARYTDRCFMLPQVHSDIGERYSYSNAAYVIAGRLVEIVAGRPWAQAVQEMIFMPLGMRHALSTPLMTPLFSVAAGHMPDDDGWGLAPYPFTPRGMAPAGSALAMSARDLLTFGQAHLHGGRSNSGAQWMSAASAADMQAALVALPTTTSLGEHAWGPGWGLARWGDLSVFGHSGGRTGFQALVTAVPNRDLVIAVQANGMRLGVMPLIRSVLADVLEAYGQIPPSAPELGPTPGGVERLAGIYGGSGFRVEIRHTNDGLDGSFHLEGLPAISRTSFVLRPTQGGNFVAYTPAGDYWDNAAFVDPDADGRPRWVFLANRLHARVAAGT